MVDSLMESIIGCFRYCQPFLGLLRRRACTKSQSVTEPEFVRGQFCAPPARTICPFLKVSDNVYPDPVVEIEELIEDIRNLNTRPPSQALN